MDVVAHEVRRHFALLDGAPAHMYVEQRRGDESWTYVRLPETGTAADADLFNAKGRIVVSRLNGEQLRVRRAELSAFVNLHVSSVLPGQSRPEWARSLQLGACGLEELQRAQCAVRCVLAHSVACWLHHAVRDSRRLATARRYLQQSRLRRRASRCRVPRLPWKARRLRATFASTRLSR